MSDLSLDGVPSFLQPKLRLFMSVDITGSTQFKQILSHKNTNASKSQEDGALDSASEPWLSPILEFYDRISVIFCEEWSTLSSKANAEPYRWGCGDRPSVWKAVGDELIFTSILTDHRQAFICVASWLKTVQRYRSTIKSHSAGLDLKCAAWIAGFPINNAEIMLDHQASAQTSSADYGDYILSDLARLHEREALPSHSTTPPSGTGIRDFIGPSIDTGFRVASLASPRKFVLSADLAFMLAHVCGNVPSSAGFPELSFYYEGRKELKGVTNGAPYPIFWINATEPNPLMSTEDEIENRRPTAASQVKLFCEHFLEKNKDTHVMQPFIKGDRDDCFKTVPLRHLEKLNKLARYWVRETNRRALEAQTENSGDEGAPIQAEEDLDALSSRLAAQGRPKDSDGADAREE